MIISSEFSDAKLLERMSRLELDAAGELYDRHGPTMYGLALTMLGNPVEAEDVLVDVMAQIWREANRRMTTADYVADQLTHLVRDHAIRKVRDRSEV